MTHPRAAKLVFSDGVLDTARSDLSAVPPGAALVVDGPDFSLTLPAGASLLLVEEQTGQTLQKNRLERRAEITLGAGAVLDYLQWQHLPTVTEHAAVYDVTQAENSQLRAGFFVGGSASEHQQMNVHQQGSRANTDLYGFCQPTRDHQHLSHTAEVLHAGSHGKSSMAYKGILDAKSKASFRGRVKVIESGKGVQAHQANHWLLLSRDAEASSRPELEIYQEDVRCSHGATVGQLDEAALFYLCARGIARHDAEAMLRRAFAGDIFDRVPEGLLPWLQAALGYTHDA